MHVPAFNMHVGSLQNDIEKERVLFIERYRRVPNKALSLSLSLSLEGTLVFGGCAFPPVSLGPAGDCPCRD